MAEREPDSEPKVIPEFGTQSGRRFVPREGQAQYMQPRWWNNGSAPAIVITLIFVSGAVALIIYSA
jgi:hypothetical protein